MIALCVRITKWSNISPCKEAAKSSHEGMGPCSAQPTSGGRGKGEGQHMYRLAREKKELSEFSEIKIFAKFC